MPKLPVVSGKETIAALRKLGFEVARQRGSHVVLRKGDRGCVVPFHDELALGTLKSVLKQAGIAEQDFIDAV